MITIYKYTNQTNNKTYIRQTSQTLEDRAGKNGYRYKHCSKFYAAIKKYGWDNFICEVLEIVNKNEADEKEKFYIKYYNSIDNGYNIDYGGHIEKSRSEETKIKISEAGKGMKNSRAKNVYYNGIPSNMTIRDYAKTHNLNENTLKNWCRQNKNGYSYF